MVRALAVVALAAAVQWCALAHRTTAPRWLTAVSRGGSSMMGSSGAGDYQPKRRDEEEEEDEDEEESEPEVRGPLPRAPNSLAVRAAAEEGGALGFSSSAIAISESKMEELEIFEGDTVRVRGARGRETLCVAVGVPDGVGEGGSAWCELGLTARSNCRCRVGDHVKVSVVAEGCKFATAVHALPFDDSLAAAGFAADVEAEVLVKRCLEPFFRGAHRPLLPGDRIECPVVALEPSEEEEEEEESSAIVGALVEFRVLDVDSTERDSDDDGVIVGDEDCEFRVSAPYLVRARDDERLDEIGYEDLGGVSKALATIRELVEAPLKRPEFFKTVGVAPPRGVLLHGAPGCGKTSIARALSQETGAFFFVINGAEILSKTTGEAESMLRKVFEQARKKAPAIIFIDELDALAPRRDKGQPGGGESEKRVVQTLCELLDELELEHADAAVVVLAATNRPNSVDGSLRRYGRLDREVDVGVPDADARLDILRVRTRDVRLADDVELEQIARDTHGFVGADVAQLCLEAGFECIRSAYGSGSAERRSLLAGYERDAFAPAAGSSSSPQQLRVSAKHFAEALNKVNPSALRETAASMPKASWDDVGGLADVKRELHETVQYPVEHAAKFRKFGLPPSKGVLFYGPPGCGKTLLAQAVAHECGANFISIKGPELLTMWFGESEANVRELFDKARASAPCILFFDEIDAIAKARGGGGGGGASEAGDRVINQILTEIDGVGARKEVFVIGATNRPEVLDAAITRPGRLDTLVYIPLPDEESRKSIFVATLRNSPVDDDVDFQALAKHSPGFSGADCAEVCKRAARFAIRDAVQAATDHGGDLSQGPYTIQKQHFELAMTQARRSVSDAELAKYAAYAEKSKTGAGGQEVTKGAELKKFSFDDPLPNPTSQDDEDKTPDAAPPQPKVLTPAQPAAQTADDENLYQ